MTGVEELHIQAQGITKAFGGSVALKGVDVTIRRGTVHCLIGENGAGKSTLGKVLAGIERPDSGELLVHGNAVQFRSPSDALGHGITAMAQEVALAGSMTIVDNVLLGVETSRLGVVDTAAQVELVRGLIESCGFRLDPHARVRDLRISDQQKVEILKALARQSGLIIMDEPTASLDRNEASALLDTIRRLRANGTTIVLVSHHLDEVLAVADDITVLRNGSVVYSGPSDDHDRESLIELMLGRQLEGGFPEKSIPTVPGEPVLEVRELHAPPDVGSVSFAVRPGEILGIAGLVGSGRTELLRAIAGVDRFVSGTIVLAGRERAFASPRAALDAGLFLIPEDRKTQGLILSRSVRENVSLPSLSSVATLGAIARHREKAAADDAARLTDVRAASFDNSVSTLSGGNQQKVMFARARLVRPRVLLVDEPTKGVDIGAKFAIHELLVSFADEGTAVVVVSSEHEELMGLAHRILVMHSGSVVAEFDGPHFDDTVVKRAIVSPNISQDSPARNSA